MKLYIDFISRRRTARPKRTPHFFLLLTLFLLPDLLPGAPKKKPTTAGEAGRGEAPYFLLKPPPARGREKERMLRLYSAPLMDRESLERVAIDYEDHTRKELREEQRALSEEFCALPPEQRKRRVEGWRRDLSLQWNRWLGIRNLFESMLIHRLSERLAPDDLKRALSYRKDVITLQQERQELIRKSWESLFRSLEREGRKEACVPESLTAGGHLPVERLHLPVYLASYRFYNTLPPEERIKLILSLKKR